MIFTEEAKWEEPFFKESKKTIEIKTKRQTTDGEIGQMADALYELMEEEMMVVEG